MRRTAPVASPALLAAVLAVLVGLSGGTLANGEGAVNIDAPEAVDATQMDPQLVISRESLIASMTEPGGHPGIGASNGDSSTPGTASTSSSNKDLKQSAAPKTATAEGYSQKHNRPLPVETALSAVSAAVEGATYSPQPSDPLQQQHQQNALEPQQQAGAAPASPDGGVAAKQPVTEQPIVTPTTASSAADDGQPSGRAPKPQGVDTQKQGDEDADDDANDEELTVGAGGEPHVRWLDCKESWWRQCVGADGRIVQPVAVQRMAAALGGLWSSTVGDGTAAADMPVRQPGAAGAVGEGAACAEYREAMEAGLGSSVRQNRTHLTSTTAVCHPLRIHVVVPLDEASFRGALATINSVIANAACPERLLFHVPSLDAENRARWATSMQDTFENVHLYQYSKEDLSKLISPSLKATLPDLASYMQWFPDRYLPHCVERLIALEAGTLVLTDVGEWWDTPRAFGMPIAAPQDCDARVGTLLKTGDMPGLIMDFMPFVENACGVRRGLALMNVTAWGALNMTEDVESSLGSGWARKCLASGVRYDEDRLALPAVQWATIGRVQRLKPSWIKLLGSDRCASKADAAVNGSKALRWAAEHRPWETPGGAGADCEVDSLWHEYDVRRPADAAGDQQRSLVRQHSSFVSQRRRLLSTVPMPLRWRRR